MGVKLWVVVVLLVVVSCGEEKEEGKKEGNLEIEDIEEMESEVL